MDKKEFVQRFIIQNRFEWDKIDNGYKTENCIKAALESWDEIEKAFEIAPTKNLWDYNDRN